MAFAALNERARRLNETLTGHRFLFDTIARRRQRRSRSTRDAVRAARAELAALARRRRRAAWRELLFNALLPGPPPRRRRPHRRRRRALGAVGPGRARRRRRRRRARHDARGSPTTASRPSRRDAPPATSQARLEQRAVELLQTFELLDEPARPAARARATPSPRRPRRRSASAGSRALAAPRSASSSATAARIARLHLRTGSYANWPVVAHAAAGNLLPDFPLINKSFELCYACADR